MCRLQAVVVAMFLLTISRVEVRYKRKRDESTLRNII